MRKEITLQEMNDINELLTQGYSSKTYGTDWKIQIPNDLDYRNQPREKFFLEKSNEFINDLFSTYRADKLSTYKKIFDYAHAHDIDLFSIFRELRVENRYASYSRYSEYLDLINYVYKQNYYEPGHDFSIYFNSFNKPTKTIIAAKTKLLSALDNSEKSFDIYCDTFNDYLKLLNSTYPGVPLDIQEQINIKKLFTIFENQDFYSTRAPEYLKFFPSLLDVDNLSDVQEDTFFSKRFCFSAQHSVSTLQKNIENSLEYIYNTLFVSLKEKDIISDYTAMLEEGSFYLYVFTNDTVKLNNLGKAIQVFHKEIQPFLQNNSEKENYYVKLFDSIYLGEKLASKNEKDLVSPNSTKKIKI